MGNLQRIHPLDRLVNDDSLFFLEAMIPFVDNNTKRILVILIKVREISAIMDSLNNPSYLSECGFNCHPKNTDEFISGICDFMPDNFRNSVNQMQQMMNMMKVMNTMNEFNDMESNNGFNRQSKGGMPNNIFESKNEHENNECMHSESLFDSVMSIIENEGN